MGSFQYKVVPFIGKSRSTPDPHEVASQLEHVINTNASAGWEFHAFNDINIEVQPGCLAGLFGGETSYMRFDQLVFRQPSTGDNASIDGNQLSSASSQRVSASTSAETSHAAKASTIDESTGLKLMKRFSLLGFGPEQIEEQLIDRGMSPEDAKALLAKAKKN